MKNIELAPLIQTKLNRPPTRARLVHRQRLFSQLDGGLERPLTLVCAGAGFGKTTLVSAWLEAVSTRKTAESAPLVAWLSLDEHDSDLHQFLYYFAMAVCKVAPKACQRVMALLKRPAQPPDRQLQTALINDLASLSQNLIVVLDDYHMIRETAVSDFLNGLLLHWPQPLHLILITRYTPPLSVAKLRANGKVVEVRNQDLRFTLEEITEYVHEMWPVPLTPSNIELLEQKTEGWIAGLQLASLSLRVMENPDTVLDSLSGTNSDIADYLVDEVLSRQPKAFHDFQLKTSFLDEFCPSLCEAVKASEDPDWDARVILDWLEHGNLFIVPLDNHREWYRYHPLFRDLLYERLIARLDQNEVADLHRRAAHWFAQSGYIDEAIDHAVAAQDLNLAVDFMYQFLPVVLNCEDQLTLGKWLMVLPQSFIPRRPEALMIQAWYLHFSWRIEAVAKILDSIETLLSQIGAEEGVGLADHAVLRGQIAALRAQQAYYEDQPDRCIACCHEVQAYLPESWTFVHSGTMTYLTLAMQAVGEGTAVEKTILKKYESLPDKTSSFALRLLVALCLKYLQAGELKQAEQTAKFILDRAPHHLTVLIGWANFTLGLVYYQWNNLEAARLHFNDLLHKQESAHQLSVRHGLIGLAYVNQASGCSAEAWEVIDLLSRLDLERAGRLSDPTLSAEASLFLDTGNLEEALSWASHYSAPIHANLFVLFEVPHLTQAKILLAGNNRDDTLRALQILDELMIFVEKHHNVRRQIEVMALIATARDRLGQTQAALEILEQALQLAQVGGFVRLFVALGSRMRQLLHELAQHNGSAKPAQLILLAFGEENGNGRVSEQVNNTGSLSSSPPPLTEIPDLVEQLTPREVQVLTLLREPLAMKEIALKLNISYGTAKRHTINLYGKLGVSSRWDAVSMAETLGIIESRQ